MDMNTPATLKKLSWVVMGVCKYDRSLIIAVVNSRTRRLKSFSGNKMLARISETYAMLEMAESKLPAVPKYKEKNAREVIPYEKK